MSGCEGTVTYIHEKSGIKEPSSKSCVVSYVQFRNEVFGKNMNPSFLLRAKC